MDNLQKESLNVLGVSLAPLDRGYDVQLGVGKGKVY